MSDAKALQELLQYDKCVVAEYITTQLIKDKRFLLVSDQWMIERIRR